MPPWQSSQGQPGEAAYATVAELAEAARRGSQGLHGEGRGARSFSEQQYNRQTLRKRAVPAREGLPLALDGCSLLGEMTTGILNQVRG